MECREHLMANCERGDLDCKVQGPTQTKQNPQEQWASLNRNGLDTEPEQDDCLSSPALVFAGKQKAVIRTALQGPQRKISGSLSYSPRFSLPILCLLGLFTLLAYEWFKAVGPTHIPPGFINFHQRLRSPGELPRQQPTTILKHLSPSLLKHPLHLHFSRESTFQLSAQQSQYELFVDIFPGPSPPFYRRKWLIHLKGLLFGPLPPALFKEQGPRFARFLKVLTMQDVFL